MSDGNINRQLLPHTPFHSGLATGRMQMKIRSEVALREILDTHFSELSPVDRQNIIAEFIQKLKM